MKIIFKTIFTTKYKRLLYNNTETIIGITAIPHHLISSIRKQMIKYADIS